MCELVTPLHLIFYQWLAPTTTFSQCYIIATIHSYWSYLPPVSCCIRVQLVPSKYLTWCTGMFVCVCECMENAQIHTHTYIFSYIIYIYLYLFISFAFAIFASASINRRCVFAWQYMMAFCNFISHHLPLRSLHEISSFLYRWCLLLMT